jgi:hypothetical protein
MVVSNFPTRRLTTKHFFFKGWLILFVFSNVIISLISPWLDSKLQLNILQGMDFFICSVLFCYLFIKFFKSINKDALLRNYIFGFIFVSVYFFIGVMKVGFIEASIYFRMLSYPFILGLIGLWLGSRISFDEFSKFYCMIALLASLYVVLEFLFNKALYSMLNAADFYALKLEQGELTLSELLDNRRRRLLNLKSLEDINFFKVAGPTFNYPSTSYLLVFGFVLSILRNRIFQSIVMFIALIILSTKAMLGCILTVMFSMIILKFKFTYRLMLVTFSLLFVSYMFIVFFIMSENLNIHLYSLISSLKNLPNNLFGNGLGYGGSLTVDRVITWQHDMIVGDSGLAIALNMFGIFSLILYFLYISVFFIGMKQSYLNNEHDFLILLILGSIILCNSLIQELAIGPYGIGIAFLIASIKHQQVTKMRN